MPVVLRKPGVVGAAFCWAIGGAVIGCVVGGLTVWMNDSVSTLRDAIILTIEMVVLYAVGFAVLGLPGGALGTFRRAERPSGSAHVLATFVFILVFAGAYWIAYRPAFWPDSDRAKMAMIAGSALIAFAAAALSLRVRQRARGAVTRRLALALSTVALLGSAGLIGAAARERTRETRTASPAMKRDSNRRVMLLGIDGADWRMLRPLMDAGRLPNFAKLCADSVSSPLATTLPTWSPIIWTSIATGMGAAKHGVHDFTEMRVPGLSRGVQRLFKPPVMLPEFVGVREFWNLMMRRDRLEVAPISSCHRRCKALWNILSDHGGRSGVVSWFATFPAEPIAGIMISDRATPAYRNGKFEPLHDIKGLTYPELLPSAVKNPKLDVEASFLDPKRYFVGGAGAAPTDYELGVVTDTLNMDLVSAASALAIWNTQHVDLLAVYLSGVDVSSHRLLHQHPEVIRRYYELIDHVLELFMAAADENTAIVVVSDHGWGFQANEPFGHEHAPDGVLIMAGSGVRSRAQLAGKPSVIDIAPTILALMGLPRASDMDGHVLADGLQTSVLNSIRNVTVASYGPYSPPEPGELFSHQATQANEKGVNRLRGLGYVGGD